MQLLNTVLFILWLFLLYCDYVLYMFKCFPACPRFQKWGYWLVGGNLRQRKETLKGRCDVQMLKIQMCFLLLCNSSESWANLCADQCGRTMQQCEHRVAVRDGPGVSDSGLRRAVISGPQCGRLVPLTSHLPSKPFSPGHKHARPVPGKGDHSQVRSGQQSDIMSVSSTNVLHFYFSRVISHAVGPPLLGWSSAHMTQQTLPRTPRPPVCWWKRVKNLQAHRVSSISHRNHWRHHLLRTSQAKSVDQYFQRVFSCSVFLPVFPQNCPTGLTSSHRQTLRTGNRQWGELSGSSTNTASQQRECETIPREFEAGSALSDLRTPDQFRDYKSRF